MENGPGVYLLFRNRQLVYVGRSKDPSARIAVHRRNGRPFDHAVAVPCDPADVAWIETALISALNPPQNRLGVTTPTPELPPQQVVRVVHLPAPRDAPPPSVYSLTEGRALATKEGLRASYDAALKAGTLPSRPRNPDFAGHGARRVIMHADLMAWFSVMNDERVKAGWRVA